MLEILKKALPILVLIGVFALGYNAGSTKVETKWKEEIHNEYVTKTEAKQATQAAVNTISAKYQEDYSALEGSTDRVIADLKSDNKRLYAKVCAPGSARSSDGRCESVIPVELHESTVRSLVKITEAADLKEKAIQDTIRKLIANHKENNSERLR